MAGKNGTHSRDFVRQIKFLLSMHDTKVILSILNEHSLFFLPITDN